MKVLKFYATWCAPCKGLEMIVESIKDQLSIPVQNVNIEEDIDLAMKYNVRSVPVMVVIDEDGKEIRREAGLLTEDKALQFING